MHCHPGNGGCWYCYTDDEGEWLFSCEFDTYLHKSCLEKELSLMVEQDLYDPELNIIAREFGMV